MFHRSKVASGIHLRCVGWAVFFKYKQLPFDRKSDTFSSARTSVVSIFESVLLLESFVPRQRALDGTTNAAHGEIGSSD